MALDYLHYCWSDKVCQQITFGLTIPEAVLQEARQRAEQRREKIDLAGRTLHKWEGKNLAADTAALADAIIASNPKLHRVDDTLVRISAPISDPATAARVRKIHGYSGAPGAPGDPALHAGAGVAEHQRKWEPAERWSELGSAASVRCCVTPFSGLSPTSQIRFSVSKRAP